MKNKNLSVVMLALSSFFLTSCDKEDLKDLFPHLPYDDDKDKQMTSQVIDFEQYKIGFISQAQSASGAGPVMLMGKRRAEDGTIATDNYAMIFNTHTPTGDDTDLHTGPSHPQGIDLGKVLIINKNMSSTPDDNEYGGTLALDFSALGKVTLKEVTVLDIDSYENMSFVRLYGHNNQMLLEKKLATMGNNSIQVVNLENTAGVVRMEVVLDGDNGGSLAGSAAIDNIKFAN